MNRFLERYEVHGSCTGQEPSLFGTIAPFFVYDTNEKAQVGPNHDRRHQAIEWMHNYLVASQLTAFADALAAGKTLQQRMYGHVPKDWADISGDPFSIMAFLVRYPGRWVRVKPEPFVSWGGVGAAGQIDGYANEEEARAQCLQRGIKLLRLEFDPETFDVLSATTEKP